MEGKVGMPNKRVAMENRADELNTTSKGAEFGLLILDMGNYLIKGN